MIDLVHLSFRSRNFEGFRWCHRPLRKDRPGVWHSLFSRFSARMKTQSDDRYQWNAWKASLLAFPAKRSPSHLARSRG